MSEEDVRVEQNLRDLIRNTNTYLEVSDLIKYCIYKLINNNI